MSKDSILLSKKHGVNPSMECCMYCGETVGIALMGKLKDDKEAPMKVVSSIEPCSACKKKFKGQIIVVQSSDGKTPDGGFATVFVEDMEKILDHWGCNETLKKGVLRRRITLMDDEPFKALVHIIKHGKKVHAVEEGEKAHVEAEDLPV